jgi:RHH-type proline utilization regulon transcriptional repressor/proline dehydrogenase/delta 1-pyrroline-5-carboxylate dehydrogenase
VRGIADLEREVFGPVLHIATFRGEAIDAVVAEINATGYGLTFGLHTRIDTRVEEIARDIRAGNVYVNRNQIGAVVGSQPFGGTGLSGTGPKAGGPAYVERFCREPREEAAEAPGPHVPPETVARHLGRLPRPGTGPAAISLPGPTGEMNRYGTVPRGPILCLGPGRDAALTQADQARASGCPALAIAPGLTAAEGVDGTLAPETVTDLPGIAGVAYWGGEATARALRVALAGREGPILPLIMSADLAPHCVTERHLCVDTTASGGNASLLAKAN